MSTDRDDAGCLLQMFAVIGFVLFFLIVKALEEGEATKKGTP